MKPQVFLALGTNVGDRLLNLAEATRRVSLVPGVTVVARGPVIETPALLPPGDRTPQPDYLNTVIALETSLSPRALFEAVKRIERDMGRVATTRWAPRIIDLDLVLWGERVVKEPGLVIPHPAMHERLFVLAPLAAIAPDAVHPVLGKSMRALLTACRGG